MTPSVDPNVIGGKPTAAWTREIPLDCGGCSWVWDWRWALPEDARMAVPDTAGPPAESTQGREQPAEVTQEITVTASASSTATGSIAQATAQDEPAAYLADRAQEHAEDGEYEDQQPENNEDPQVI